jgi:hypothetical protein
MRTIRAYLRPERADLRITADVIGFPTPDSRFDCDPRFTKRCAMSYVIAAPETMAAAATDLAAVGSTLSAAHMAAASPTVAVMPAGADEVRTNILPGLSVTVVGEAEGIRFLMTNTTDENIIVDLTVTGPNFPKDQENTAYQIYVPPTRRRNPRAAAYSVYVPPNSFPNNPRPVFYSWELPPGVYNASVQPPGGPSSEVGTGLVVTAPIRSVSGGNVAFPIGHHVIVSDHLAS